MALKISISKEAYDKTLFWVDTCPFEVSGFGLVKVENGLLRVVDSFLLDQKGTGASTEIDPLAINKLMYQLHRSGVEGLLKWWWHSHVNMGCFWSSTDQEAMRTFGNADWIVSTVFNKKHESLSSYYSPNGAVTPIGQQALFYDKLDLSVESNALTEIWMKEYTDKVKREVIETASNGWMSQNGVLVPMTGGDSHKASKKDESGTNGEATTSSTVSQTNGVRDNYGLNAGDRRLLAQTGFLEFIDEYLQAGFSSTEILELAEAGWTCDDVDHALKQFTAEEILIEARIDQARLESRRAQIDSVLDQDDGSGLDYEGYPRFDA